MRYLRKIYIKYLEWQFDRSMARAFKAIQSYRTAEAKLIGEEQKDF